MTEFCMLSLRAYDALLGLFPGELRSEFGSEMREAFEEDFKFESTLSGVTGVLRVWRIVLLEVIRIALPAWFRNPLVAVPLLSACTVVTLQSSMLMIEISRGARSPLLYATLVAIAIDTPLTMLTAFVAVYRWKTTRPIALNLR